MTQRTWHIGLTGGIGSGKSTVAGFLARRGAAIIDADAISRSLTASGGRAMAAIARNFGDDMLSPDGAMDRQAMRERILQDPQAKRQLEHIIHPLVSQITAEQAQAAVQAGRRVLVFDVPLLVESGERWRQQVDRVIVVDCDVIQADGGTRCASITGGWVALRLAVNKLMKAGVIVSDPMIDHVAAVSCGVYAGQEVLDLDYAEDSVAGTDGNFVITGRGRMIEVQMSAEGATFSRDEMGKLLDLAEAGVAALVAAQKAAVA